MPQETPTPTPPPFYTATLFPTLTPQPSATYSPPTITPTIEPLDATTNAQVNVRTGPDQSKTSLGLIDFGAKVQIIGKDASGKWWRIVYPGASSGVGWVTAAFITFSGDADK
ncbi:MAG: SH3 domain-containing protein, partial [Anaerolineales bacterium]